MGLKIPPTDEGVLNMTPMIDIVFQLILFFLFNLRFKSLDYRIESQLPKDRGINATPQIVTDIPSIKVAIFRLNEDDPNNARTKFKIAGVEFLEPVYIWTGKRYHDLIQESERDKWFLSNIQAKIAALAKAGKDLKGEISTPLPSGASVPHSDVIRVLDCFLAESIKEVNFEGTPAPLPKSKGGHQ